MLTDPIADLLTRIKNGYMAKKIRITAPYSQMKEEMVKILLKTNAVGNVKVENDKKGKKQLVIDLFYSGTRCGITFIEKISKPGRRVYVKTGGIPKVLGGKGNTIISTSSGLMVGSDAKQKKLGGELICKYW
jgi:small subunit ribosomal protein S8